MCGRVRLSSDVSDIKLVFSIPPHRPTSNTAPNWNVAPTDPLPMVRYDARAGEPSLDVMRWGLVPFWAKDIKLGFSNVNAKAEGIENKPVFRGAFQRWRCLVSSITSTSGYGWGRSLPTCRVQKTYPAEEMTCWRVSTGMGNVKNNDPSLIEPWRSPLTKGFRPNWRRFDLG